MRDFGIDMDTFAYYINQLNTPVNVIVDAGCNDGVDSYKLKQLYPKADVYGIEGSSINFGKYKLSEKSDPTVVMFLKAAIYSRTGQAMEFYQSDGPGYSSGLFSKGGNIGQETVQTITLADLLPGIDIDVLKIDVEGAIYNALVGLGNKIYDVKAMHIEVETRPYFVGQTLQKAVHSHLIEYNFELVKSERVHVDVQQYDEIWINKKYIKE